MELNRITERILRIRPTDRPGGVNPIARPELAHAFAHFFDYSGAIIAGRERQCRLSRIGPGADVSLNRINANRVYPHEHLAGPGPQLRHADQFHHLRLTELFHTDRIHRFAFYFADQHSPNRN